MAVINKINKTWTQCWQHRILQFSVKYVAKPDDCSIAEFAISKTAVSMDVCLLCLLCAVYVPAPAMSSPTGCVCVSNCNLEISNTRLPRPDLAIAPQEII
jgi:hypothetical protein